MKRKDFLKKTLLATAGIAAAGSASHADKKENKKTTQVGFEHIPNKGERKMNKEIHRAESRGHANHGWLDTHHTFSFANYYNPERMHFGALRVLNDDRIAGGSGFGRHPHNNMEIISIPISGALEHKDSMGNSGVINEGEIQVMSAGTGVYHSEYNHNPHEEAKFLQIWVFPNKENVTPRYDQIKIGDILKRNEFSQILSPSPEDQGVWIHQEAWFHIGDFDSERNAEYQIRKKGNGLYAFVIDGEIAVEGEKLGRRDGIGLWDTDSVKFNFSKNSRVLLMEVPMNIG